MTLATPEENKAIYRDLHDRIIEKRFQSPSPIRRHAHRRQYQMFVDLISPGSTVLDAGCGEGILSVLLAGHGCHVTGFDISEPNIVASKQYAEQNGVADKVTFSTADIEHILVADKSFDYVISSHVLEHVPDFTKAASELSRIAKKQVIIAIPTCLNSCAMVLLGGDKYWTISRRTPYAIFYGFFRVLKALVTGAEGVNEGYEGNMQLIHIRRFPWRGKKTVESGNLKVIAYSGSSYVFPYLPFLLPITWLLEKMSWLPIIRELGYGVTYVCEPRER